MSLLERIAVLRNDAGGISINKLEKEAGLTRGSLAKWDNHEPSYDKLKKVADYFNVTVDYLLGNEQKEKPTVVDDGQDEVTKQINAFIQSSSKEELEDVAKYIEFIKSKRK